MWRLIEEAPKNGEILYTVVKINNNPVPVFFAWVDNVPSEKIVKKKGWLFSRKTTVTAYESGWRILILHRQGEYALHGSYGPIFPKKWMYLAKLEEE